MKPFQSDLTPELQSILANEHFRQLMISHDLISSQIYQSPTLRLYPSGSTGIAHSDACVAHSNKYVAHNEACVAHGEARAAHVAHVLHRE